MTGRSPIEGSYLYGVTALFPLQMLTAPGKLSIRPGPGPDAKGRRSQRVLLLRGPAAAEVPEHLPHSQHAAADQVSGGAEALKPELEGDRKSVV